MILRFPSLGALLLLPIALGCGSTKTPRAIGADAAADAALSDSGSDGGPSDGGGDDDDASIRPGGETYFFVVSQTALGEVNNNTTPPTAPGVNVDMTADNVCGDGSIEDFQSGAPDNEQGVDNQFVGVAAGIGQVSAELDFDELLTNGLLTGNLLLLIEVEDVNELTNDERVHVNIWRGVVPGGGAPGASGGVLTANQTFDYQSVAVASDLVGTIAGGRLSFAVASLPISVPALDQSLDLTLEDAQVRFDITATTLSNGIIGGKFTVIAVLAQVAKFAELLPGGEGTLGLVETVLNGAADLDKSGEACTSISAAIKFSGVKATKGNAL